MAAPRLIVAACAAFAIVLLVRPEDASTRTLFETHADIVLSGKTPISVVSGDLNGDGRPDLVATEVHDGTLSTWLNRGQRRFDAKTSSVTPQFATSIAPGDCNGDGVLDMAIAYNNPGTLEFLPGNGDGSFASAVTIGILPLVRRIALADLNADGDLDVVAASDQDSVVIWYGDGTGMFGGRMAIATNDNPYWIEFGDVDDNGFLDIAIAHTSDSRASILLNQGGGVFGPRLDLPLNWISFCVDLADLDGDGNLDVLASSDPVHWFRGNGDGTFAAPTLFPELPASVFVHVDDINDDGTRDIITERNLLLRHAGGSTQTIKPFMGVNPTQVAVGDFDDDGKLDLAAGHSPNTHIWLLYGNGDGSFGSSSEFSASGTPGDLAIADLNTDGWLDVAAVGEYVAVWLGVGDGALGPRMDYPTLNAVGVAFGDVDGDQVLDMAVTKRYPGALSVRLGSGNGTFGSEIAFPSVDDPGSIDLANLNGDAHLDVVLGTGSSQASVYQGGGFGGYVTHIEYPGSAALTLGDWNGDGHMDYAGQIFLGLQVGLGSGSGTFTSLSSSQTVGSCLVSADVDGDGVLDLASGAQSLGFFDEDSVLIMSGIGDGTFERLTALPVGNDPYFGAAGDFDRDGHPDLVFGNQGSNTLSILYGGSVGAEIDHIATRGRPSHVAVADMDADGWEDIVVSLPSAVGVLRNRGSDVLQVPGAPRVALRLAARPNPVVDDVRFTFGVPSGGRASLRIYDIMGRAVRTLHAGMVGEGDHVVAWDRRSGSGTRVPAGVYLAELAAGSQRVTRRVVVLP